MTKYLLTSSTITDGGIEIRSPLLFDTRKQCIEYIHYVHKGNEYHLDINDEQEPNAYAVLVATIHGQQYTYHFTAIEIALDIKLP
jgi:hypothetical protein